MHDAVTTRDEALADEREGHCALSFAFGFRSRAIDNRRARSLRDRCCRARSRLLRESLPHFNVDFRRHYCVCNEGSARFSRGAKRVSLVEIDATAAL